MRGACEGGGRGNLRAAKTPPLQSAFAGMPLRVALRSRCRHFRRLHARTIFATRRFPRPPPSPRIPCQDPNKPHINDAARRVATVFEKWDCLIESYLLERRESHLIKGLNPYETFTVVSPLVPGGLNPILPFLRGRSDAACRVVIRPSRLPSMGTDGLYRDAAPLGRALAAARHRPCQEHHIKTR